MLATSIAGFCQNSVLGVALPKALDAALRVNEQRRQDPDRLSRAIANCLAEVNPGALLHYPATCEPVQSVLRELAVEQGWLVFGDRIENAEGTEIANTASPETPISVPIKSVQLKEVIEQLPLSNGRLLYSFWLMVQDGGPCQPGDTKKSIYDAMRARLEGEIEDDLAQGIGTLFPDGLAKYDSWRKALKRIEEHFAGQPERSPNCDFWDCAGGGRSQIGRWCLNSRTD